LRSNIKAIGALLVAGALTYAQPALADCNTIEIPYSASDQAYSARAQPVVGTAFVSPPPGWRITKKPYARHPTRSFDYCDFEKRPKVIPPIPVIAQADYKRRNEAFGYKIYIIANNSNEGPNAPITENPNYLYRTTTVGTINRAERTKLTGFTIVYEVRKDMEWAMSEADLADLEKMVDKARLQALIDQPLPDVAEAKAQIAAHAETLTDPPPPSTKSAATPPKGQPAEPAAPKKKAKPKLRLPGGLPGIPNF
jgi:hypothetical protein